MKNLISDCNFMAVFFTILLTVSVVFVSVGISERSHQKNSAVSLKQDLDELENKAKFFWKSKKEDKETDPKFEESFKFMENFYSEEEVKKRKKRFRLLDPTRRRFFDGRMFTSVALGILKVSGALLVLIFVVDYGVGRFKNE